MLWKEISVQAIGSSEGCTETWDSSSELGSLWYSSQKVLILHSCSAPRGAVRGQQCWSVGSKLSLTERKSKLFAAVLVGERAGTLVQSVSIPFAALMNCWALGADEHAERTFPSLEEQ